MREFFSIVFHISLVWGFIIGAINSVMQIMEGGVRAVLILLLFPVMSLANGVSEMIAVFILLSVFGALPYYLYLKLK